MKKLLLILYLFGTAAMADDESAHVMAHIGSSFICQNVVYGMMHKGLDAPRLTSHIFGAGICTMVGAAYESMNGASSSYMLKRMGNNAEGVVLGIATIELFKF